MPDSRQLRRSVRGLIPPAVRQRLYDWSPSRKRRWKQVPGRTEAPPGGGAVLTFDDGPDPAATPEVLAALDRAGVRATFFVLGEHALESPRLIRGMVDAGHEVALHGMTHRRHDLLGREEAEAELEAGVEAIADAGGGRPTWYRPPFGASSPLLAELCEKLGLQLAYWSAWGQDWEESSPERISRLVRRDLKPGAIVLLHDSPRYGQRASAADTVAAIPLIAASAAAEGIEWATLSSAVAGERG